MRVYIQWARATPEDWQPYDINSPGDVRKLARKPVPGSNPHIDDEPGWINALNCQGVVFDGYDHISIEYLTGDVLVITGWQDDPEDFAGGFWATQWRFEPPAPDPRLGGEVNTRQSVQRWATASARSNFAPETPLHPWGEFAPPPSAVTLHGVWLRDSVHGEHLARRTVRGWREWL